MKSVVIALLLLIVIYCVDAKCPKCSKAENCLGCTRTPHCVWCDGVCDSSKDSTLSCQSRIETPEDCSEGCTSGGKHYAAGESFPSDDGCNTCVCSEDGTVACTEMACIPVPTTCEYNGKTYQEGESFPSDDGCNTCSCSAGRVICTLMACTPGCQTNDDCESEQFCEKDSCHSVDGTCSTRSLFCTKIYSPVCGCDDQTYSNDCEAHVAGVNVKSEGKCEGTEEPEEPVPVEPVPVEPVPIEPVPVEPVPVEQPCTTDDDCESEQFCQKDTCDYYADGTCATRSVFCTFIFKPVCGCDDQTYSNDCAAHAAGVNVKSQGSCEGEPEEPVPVEPVPIEPVPVEPVPVEPVPVEQPCTTDDDCESGKFCEKDTCDFYADGTCSIRSLFCTQIYSPVCGCDDQTYSNDCEAHVAGVNVKSQGECATPEGPCKTNNDCKDGEYCKKDSCDDSLDGACTANSELCSALFDPVCGCDGKTYGNLCEAAGAGVNIKNTGECDGGSDNTCKTNTDCNSGWFCEKEGCDEETDGYCTEIYAECAEISDPVCACDGHTYSNACEAAREGENVNHAGGCEVGKKCKSSDECESGYFCEKSPCDPDSEYCQLSVCDSHYDGVCSAKSDFCSTLYKPVCGCDGITYSNTCEANNAGVNIQYDSECDGPNENDTMDTSHHGR